MLFDNIRMCQCRIPLLHLRLHDDGGDDDAHAHDDVRVHVHLRGDDHVHRLRHRRHHHLLHDVSLSHESMRQTWQHHRNQTYWC